MERNISPAAILCIVLISLAAVIGIGYGAFAISQGSANEGNQELATQTSYASKSWKDDYDAKDVTGAQVQSLLSEADNKGIAVFVNTRGMCQGSINSSAEVPVLKHNGKYYMNYGTVFDYEDDSYKKASGEIAMAENSGLLGVRDGTSLKVDYNPKLDNGKLVRNKDYTGLYSNGSVNYIDTHAKFRSNLIYGSDGEVVGVILSQATRSTASTSLGFSNGSSSMGGTSGSYVPSHSGGGNIPMTGGSTSGGSSSSGSTSGGSPTGGSTTGGSTSGGTTAGGDSSGGSSSDKTEPGDSNTPSGEVIPEGGTYYVGVTSTGLGKYTGATQTLSAGDYFPSTVNPGDVYVYGDYEYRYNCSTEYNSWFKDDSYPGWGVKRRDASKTIYGPMLSVINGKPVTNLRGCFSMTQITEAPALSENAKCLDETFLYCGNLIEAPVIPEGVVSMYSTFEYCFTLESAPIIPENVVEIGMCFHGCNCLTGDIVINSTKININDVSVQSTFAETIQPITLWGDCPQHILEVLAKGHDNVTVPYNPSIPQGGTYYRGVTSKVVGDYSGATSVLNAGDSFPVTVKSGDVYVYEDYEYRWRQVLSVDTWESSSSAGWGVAVIDKTKESYGAILISIAEQSITSASYTFYNCVNLKNAPAIPDTVKSKLLSTFEGCTSLKYVPSLSMCKVTDMSRIFYNCKSLSSSPTLPTTVSNLKYAWAGCTSLKWTPFLPSSVTDLSHAFEGCVALTTCSATLNGNVSNIAYCFAGCTSLTGNIDLVTRFLYTASRYEGAFSGTVLPITLKGIGTYKEEIAATAENGNVTVG